VSDPKTRRFFLGALTAASAVRVWGANDKVNVASWAWEAAAAATSIPIPV
jgi:hypothetical protein